MPIGGPFTSPGSWGVCLEEKPGRVSVSESPPALTQKRPWEPIVFSFTMHLERQGDALPVVQIYRGHPDIAAVSISQSTDHPDFHHITVTCHPRVRSISQELVSAHLNFIGGKIVRPTAWEHILSDDELV